MVNRKVQTSTTDNLISKFKTYGNECILQKKTIYETDQISQTAKGIDKWRKKKTTPKETGKNVLISF